MEHLGYYRCDLFLFRARDHYGYLAGTTDTLGTPAQYYRTDGTYAEDVCFA
jgi:hypothetical protein